MSERSRELRARLAQRHVAGIPVRLDDRMGPNQVAMVNEHGVGVSFEDGEILPCILPPAPDETGGQT